MGSNQIKLSVVIPCFNEESTLRECVNKVRKISHEDLSVEIIIVDDGSTDNSSEVGKKISLEQKDVIFLQHEINKGKGAAVRTGFEKVTGDFVAIQDADLEYDPNDFKNLLVPLIDNKA